MPHRLIRNVIRRSCALACREWLLRDASDPGGRRERRASLRANPTVAELIYPQLYNPRAERRRFLNSLVAALRSPGASLDTAYLAALGLHICVSDRGRLSPPGSARPR